MLVLCSVVSAQVEVVYPYNPDVEPDGYIGVNEPPFTDQSDQGIMGVFTDDAEVRSIIRILDGINANAEVA